MVIDSLLLVFFRLRLLICHIDVSVSEVTTFHHLAALAGQFWHVDSSVTQLGSGVISLLFVRADFGYDIEEGWE